jgi:hypothetical protein
MESVEELKLKLADIAAQIHWKRDEIIILESPSLTFAAFIKVYAQSGLTSLFAHS